MPATAPARRRPVPEAAPPPVRVPTFAEAFAEWREIRSRQWTSENTSKNFDFLTRGWTGVLGDLPVAALRPADLARLYSACDDGHLAGTTVEQARKYLGAFLSWAAAMEYIVGGPLSRHVWPKVVRESVRSRTYIALSPEQVAAVAATIPPSQRRLIRFAYLVGLRLGEMLAARWSWIVPGRREGTWSIEVPRNIRKTRRPHLQPLPARALEVLGPRGRPEDLLFPEAPCDRAIRKYLAIAGRKLGIGRLSPHTLRRSWATALAEAGVPIVEIQRIGGWASLPSLLKAYLVSGGEDRHREYCERIGGAHE